MYCLIRFYRLFPVGKNVVLNIREEGEGFIGQKNSKIVSKNLNFHKGRKVSSRRIRKIFCKNGTFLPKDGKAVSKNGNFVQNDRKVVSRIWKFPPEG